MVYHHIYLLSIFDLDLGVKVAQNIALYPLHHVTYAPAKFEVPMSNGLGEDAFARKNIFWPWHQGHMKYCPAPSTLCDLCTCNFWNCYAQRLRSRCIYKKIQYLTLTMGSHEILSSTLYFISPDQCICKVWCCYVLCFRRCINKKMQSLTLTPITQGVAQYPLHHVTYAHAKFEVVTLNGLGGDEFTRKYIIWPWHLQEMWQTVDRRKKKAGLLMDTSLEFIMD